MTRKLFSSRHLPVFGAAICLLLGVVYSPVVSLNTEGLVSQEAPITVTLDNVSDTTPNSIITVDLGITYPDTFDMASIEELSFALAYDTSVLTLWDVSDNGLVAECGWFLNFIVDQDSTRYPNSVLWIVAGDPSKSPLGGLGCLDSVELRITLQFVVRDDSSLFGASTTLDFYWRDCHDNVIWTKDHDTTLLALQVLDADSADITDESNPLPSFAGPDSSCFNPFGDTVIVRAVRFQSGKIEFKASTDVTETPLDEGNLPTAAHLRQNYPNPFNPSTTVEFYLPERTGWRLEIINLNGKIVAEFSGTSGPGNVTLNWDGRDRKDRLVSSGVYFYRLVTEKHSSSRKMLLLK